MSAGAPALRIGVDLGGTKIEAIGLDAAGAELWRRRIDSPRGDPAATVEAVAALVEACEAEVGRRGTVGVGAPGSPSPRTGVQRNSNSAWLNGFALRRALEARLARRVPLANDANCMTLSEAVDGAGADGRVVFGVILGTGCGGGLSIDRRVIDGRNGIAGEWGHNPLPGASAEELRGARCWCGREGCLEQFLSGPAIERDYARGGEARPLPEMARRARGGEVAAIEALARFEARLARALAAVVNLLDPDVIVLAGGVSNLEGLDASLPRLMAPFVFADAFDTPVRRAVHGDSSGVRGAAWLGAASGA